MDTNAPETAPDTVVTLVDLQNILVVFDLASSRGAFRGGELTPIGQLYDKIGVGKRNLYSELFIGSYHG